MTPEVSGPGLSVRRRQMLLAGGLLAGILAIAIGGALLYEYRKPAGLLPASPNARTVPVTTPGGGVDPRDAWRGLEGAAIEEIRRQLAQVTDDLKRIRRERDQERLEEKQRTERAAAVASLATPPAVTPVPRPPELPVPPPRAPVPALAAPLPGMPPGAPPGAHAPQVQSPGIFKVVLADPGQGSLAGRGGGARSTGLTPAADTSTSPATSPRASRTAETYLPSTAFMRAVLLSGLDAPTGGQAQNNPHPVLLRVLDHAQLPNSFRSDVKDCFILGSGYGDLSSERAYVRTESLACVRESGEALDTPLKGVLVGPDGKAGVRGRLVSKTGQVLANALVAGLISGLGTALTSSAITQSVSPLGATQTIDSSKALQAGIGQGLARGLDRLVQYYISLADKIYPVVEVDAGQVVDVVVTRGVNVVTGAEGDPNMRSRDGAGAREYFAASRR
jgi:conjugal transfer pilus assembly protein TraB